MPYRHSRSLYGWYSEKQAEWYGVLAYIGRDGGELLVTDISVGREAPWCAVSKTFSDYKLVGELERCSQYSRKSVGSINDSLYNRLFQSPEYNIYPKYPIHGALIEKSLMSTSKFGWYSKKQNEVGGSCVYEDMEGKDVFVTHISDSKEHGTGWQDIEFMGRMKVFKFRVHHGNTKSMGPKLMPLKLCYNGQLTIG